ncbi:MULTISPECIES: glycoside hydrolase family 3 protein [unclassified Leptospira]|uniref:glycoside hydrolase family 3 protein n=1 Tax=unclassified Leptospira TaxID=2633828 RepID=UPI0002BD4225|nr:MULTISPECIES: glycoside hydrolase family 3 protein [unclassified Leptospira]EMJ98407.1 glycosyl hydrolase family 3, N-terminal domain protein [Leptospira sp. B5-022]MCR1792629.1 glycoside hydrolase family 3 protein [Leptospira sp. id769339]
MFKRFLIAGFSAAFLIFLYFWLGQFRSELQAQEIQEGMLRQAEEITSKLSAEELVGQVIHVAIPGTVLDPIAKKEIETIKPGGVILFGRNLGSKSEIKSLNKDLQTSALENTGLPLLISVDQEGGRVIRVKDGVTQFPGAMALGQTKDKDMAKKVGFVTSYQLRKLGLNFLFAPDMDINNNPFNPVINTRSLGSNLETVLNAGVSYEEGARLGGSIPVIKHFPGHGDTNVDSHLGLPKIEKTLEELKSFELIPFQTSIQNGADAIMSAHIVYPKIDPNFPATLSSKILGDLLRKEFQYQGLIITDAMEMDAIDEHYQKEDPGVLALLAGADIVLMTSWGPTTQSMKDQILKAYKKGTLIREGKDLLKEAVKRQIYYKLKYGIISEFGDIAKSGRANSVFPKELPEILKNHFIEQDKNRDNLFSQYYQDTLNRDVSRKAIVSFPKTFLPEQVSATETVFYLKGEEFVSDLRSRSLSNSDLAGLRKKLEKKEVKRAVVNSFTQTELDLAASLAQKFPEAEIVCLHYGTPFLDLPDASNLKILFSFSPTLESKKALLYSVLDRKNEIPLVDLILKPNPKKASASAGTETDSVSKNTN